MKLWVVKHATFEGPGAVAAWARERGHTLSVTENEYGQALPTPDDFDALVLMGGPMSVNEEGRYGWLRPEKALVRDTLASGKKLLGVCLGAQMIASALGAEVRPNAYKEIGWFPLEITAAGREHPFFRGLPGVLPVFHWHGETFGLPAGALHLARTAACENQGFAIGTQALALQCHLEVDAESLKEMAVGGRDELDLSQPFIQSEAVLLGQPENLQRLAGSFRTLMDQWIQA